MVTPKPKNRLTTDAFREIKNTFNRYVSILVLAALAVAFLSGLRSAAPDMQYTADNFYDRTHLMDGYVLSTLGITDEDLDALAGADGIEQVEGARDLDATAIDRIVNVRSMPERINLLEVAEGRLPEGADECVTEHLLLVKLGLQVGDTLELTLDEDHEGDLENTAYTIVGVVNSPLYVGLDRGASSLGNGSVDAFMYVPGENFTFDYYTCAYFTGEGLAVLDGYGDEYEDQIDALIDGLDGLADERAQLRHDTLIGDAQAELDDARREFEDAKADAERELADARQELEDARKELDDGWADYHDGEDTYAREIADAEKKLADALADLRQGEIDLADGRQEYEDGLAEYQDGLQKYEDGLAEYNDGLAEYEDGKAKYEDALKEYEDGKKKYEDGLKEYEDGLAQYNSGLASYQSGKAEYNRGLAEYNAGKARLEQQEAAGKAQFEAAMAKLEPLKESNPAAYAAAVKQLQDEMAAGQAQLAVAKAQLDAAKAQLDAGAAQMNDASSELGSAKRELDAAKKELDKAKAELDEGEQELADAKAELDEGEQELADAKRELDDAQAELADAERKLADAQAELDQGEIDLRDGWAEYYDGVAELQKARAEGRQELDDALVELNDGEAEYADGLKEYEDGKAEADEEIADAQKKLDDAQAELDDVEECEWYVLSRFTNAGIVGYSQDSDRISNLANVFPVIFFLVAALACLTTMTRMVEEQRTQIGSLKALGFSRLSIAKKYIGYAFSASLVGGVLGLGLGCTLIPLVIANAFNIMYAIPALEFKPQVGLYFWSVLAAVACTTGAALWACLSTLIATPANLMRPRAPKAGRRVLLERIGFVWKRLTFTWKVTMRNLFRYQRRFWMTVIGIGGCTALIVTGFGLHESIFSILNEQFDHVFLYDATVGLDKDAGAEKLAAVEQYLTDSPWVEDYLLTSQTLLEASGDGPAQNVYLFAVDDEERFNQFIQLGHRLNDEPVTLPDRDVVITEKLSELLGVSIGDTITLDDDGKRVDAVISDIAENYVSHYVYVSDTCYRELFGEVPEQDVMLLRYADGAGEAESDTVSSDLMSMDGVDSYSYIATIRDNFTDSMEAIDYAVVIIILAAAALAFVVLYNLTNINITERTRELATLKVLGFFDREVTAYVYRENLFLTLFGIVLGLVMGRFLHAWMVLTVEVDVVMFGRTAPPYAYILAAALTVVFSVAVNIAAHFKLKKVDMVESLKTVE